MNPKPEQRYVLISPCRDEEQYMRETLDSVVCQTLRPAKWVIVDDGSTDATPQILAEYAAKHDWIEIVTRADRGGRKVGPGVIDAFYAGYGINVGGNVSLLNELKAPGIALMASGFFIAAGAVVVRLAPVSAFVAAFLYLSFGLSRLVSIDLDGLPADGLVQAAGIELVFGLACVFVLVLRRREARSLADFTSAPKPTARCPMRSAITRSSPSNAPPQMNRMLLVSICRNS